MLKDNKQLITVTTYAQDTDKTQQSISRFLIAGRPLPGIEEYYKLAPSTYILKKSSDYKSATNKVKRQRQIFSEK